MLVIEKNEYVPGVLGIVTGVLTVSAAIYTTISNSSDDLCAVSSFLTAVGVFLIIVGVAGLRPTSIKVDDSGIVRLTGKNARITRFKDVEKMEFMRSANASYVHIFPRGETDYLIYSFGIKKEDMGALIEEVKKQGEKHGIPVIEKKNRRDESKIRNTPVKEAANSMPDDAPYKVK